MNFVVAWQLHRSEPEGSALESELRGVLAPYSWVKALDGVFVVRAAGKSEWDTIHRGLTRVAQDRPVFVIMSPIMSGGKYNGLLEEDVWKEINEITNADLIGQIPEATADHE